MQSQYYCTEMVEQKCKQKPAWKWTSRVCSASTNVEMTEATNAIKNQNSLMVVKANIDI